MNGYATTTIEISEDDKDGQKGYVNKSNDVETGDNGWNIWIYVIILSVVVIIIMSLIHYNYRRRD